MTGIFALGAMTLIYIILNQVYTYNFYPDAIQNGVNATNLNWIDVVWTFWPVPVLIAIVWGMITAGRESRGDTYGIE